MKKIKVNDTDGGMLNKRSGGEKTLYIIVFIIFVIHSFTLIYPVLWMLVSSLKTKYEYILGNPFSFPEAFQWSNYSSAFKKLYAITASGDTVYFDGMLLNSLWYVALSVSCYVFVPAVTGYVMSKYNFKGRNLLYTIVITSMMIPIVGSSAAYLKFLSTINIYNTPLFVLYNGLGAGFGPSFLVYYGFFKSVSWSYAEAVQIDGGGPFTIFFKIMLPQAAPVLLTYGITYAISCWYEYESILLYLPDYPTVSAGLISYKAQLDRTGDFPVYFAGLIISMIPTLILFSVFSNRIMGSISIGGLKG